MTNYWAVLEKEALTDSEPVTPHTALPIMFWVMKTAAHKLSPANESFLKHIGTKSEPSGVSHQQGEGKG